MCYKEAIDYYVGREVIPSVDYQLQDESDGVGLYFKFWNVEDRPQPTLSEIEDIISNISFAVDFGYLRERVTDAQLEAQKRPMFLANKFYLDCTDITKNLLLDARTSLIGTGRTKTTLVDYQGSPSDITLDDLDLIMGNPEKNMVGEFPTRRLDLHEQEIEIIKKILLGQPYEISFT